MYSVCPIILILYAPLNNPSKEFQDYEVSPGKQEANIIPGF